MIIPVLIGITIVIQLLIDITPGDPAKLMLGMHATPEKIEELRKKMKKDEKAAAMLSAETQVKK